MAFSFFTRKKAVPIHLGRIGTDIHSHLLPGIDDGAQDLDQTIAMISKFVDLGYKKLITTPHIMADLYPNSKDTILPALETVKKELQRLNIPVQLEAAAEYFTDDFLFDLIGKEKLLTFLGNHVLFEFSFHNQPMMMDETIFKMQAKGYKPVLAHYERYMFFADTQKADEFREKGIKIQVNINSLTGHYGPHPKKQAEKLIEQKLVDIIGTDCHRIEHLILLERNLDNKYLHKILDLDLINFNA
jgi:tyrosine-protein phosphatase YwqE